jgi:hypothetical protein
LHKYRTQELVMPHHVYYQQAQQVVAQQVGKTFVSVWNWDSQEVELKISMTEIMTAFALSEDGHYLYGGGSTGTHPTTKELSFSGNCHPVCSSRRKPYTRLPSTKSCPSTTTTSSLPPKQKSKSGHSHLSSSTRITPQLSSNTPLSSISSPSSKPEISSLS